MLQALRGGGVAALAAMPRVARREGLTWARPWLAQPRTAIDAYARRHRLRWVDDDSNDDERFARNRMRRQVWPALEAAFADAEATIVAASERAQHAAAVVDEIAALDLASIAGDDGLDIAAWRRLSPARQRQAMLRWLRRSLAAPPPASLLERLLEELRAAESQRRWPSSGGELVAYRGRLRVLRAASSADAPAPVDIDLSRVGEYEIVGWQGAFRVDEAAAGGIAVARARRLEVRARLPGDRFQAGPRRPPRSLKLQFQSCAVAPALRDVPIVCIDGEPAFVPGLGVDARVVAAAGEPQVTFTWLPCRRARRSPRGAG